MPQGGGHRKIVFQQNHKYPPKIQKFDLHTRKDSGNAKLRRKIQIPFRFFQWWRAVYRHLFVSRYLAQNRKDDPYVLIYSMERELSVIPPGFARSQISPPPSLTHRVGFGGELQGVGLNSLLHKFHSVKKNCEKVISPMLQHGEPIGSRAGGRFGALNSNEFECLMALAMQQKFVFLPFSLAL